MQPGIPSHSGIYPLQLWDKLETVPVADGFWFGSDHYDADEARHEWLAFTMADHHRSPSLSNILGEAIGAPVCCRSSTDAKVVALAIKACRNDELTPGQMALADRADAKLRATECRAEKRLARRAAVKV